MTIRTLIEEGHIHFTRSMWQADEYVHVEMVYLNETDRHIGARTCWHAAPVGAEADIAEDDLWMPYRGPAAQTATLSMPLPGYLLDMGLTDAELAAFVALFAQKGHQS